MNKTLIKVQIKVEHFGTRAKAGIKSVTDLGLGLQDPSLGRQIFRGAKIF